MGFNSGFKGLKDLMPEVKYFLSEVLRLYMEICGAGNSYEQH